MDYSQVIPGCAHFKWSEALYLPSWKVYHIPSDDEQTNIIKLAQIMEQVREYLNSPINTHVWIRPILNNPDSPYHGQDYNVLVGGAPHSAHKSGSAIDFNPVNMSCDEAKAKLLIKLEEFDLRMEKDTTNWIHLDIFPPNPHRFF